MRSAAINASSRRPARGRSVLGGSVTTRVDTLDVCQSPEVSFGPYCGTGLPIAPVATEPGAHWGMAGMAVETSHTDLVRVVIADDAEDVRLLLRLQLKKDARFVVVGEAADGHEAIAV